MHVIWEEVLMTKCNLLYSIDRVHRASLIAGKNWRIVGTQRLRPSLTSKSVRGPKSHSKTWLVSLINYAKVNLRHHSPWLLAALRRKTARLSSLFRLPPVSPHFTYFLATSYGLLHISKMLDRLQFVRTLPKSSVSRYHYFIRRILGIFFCPRITGAVLSPHFTYLVSHLLFNGAAVSHFCLSAFHYFESSLPSYRHRNS